VHRFVLFFAGSETGGRGVFNWRTDQRFTETVGRQAEVL